MELDALPGMSNKHKKDARQPMPVATGMNNQRQLTGKGGGESENAPPATEAVRIRELIAGQHSKAAVEVAKELYKRRATAESEGLLIAAYEARIRDLVKQGMSVEARSLLNLVGERFPSARDRLREIQFEIRAGEDNLGELVAPLQDPNLAPGIREKIETAVRQRVQDLSALAEASSLPALHPLREGAVGLLAALQAVTRERAEEAVVFLPQVSRRSPLASWKALVNAIASFYRGEDESCQKWLEAIAPDSVPARLIPPIQAMLGKAPGFVFSAATLKLMSSVASGREVLRATLACLDQAMDAGNKKLILDKAREAVNLCRQCCPDLTEKLRQHIAIRCMLLNFAVEPVCGAIGRPREDAYWWRLMARSFEEVAASIEQHAQSVLLWEKFRQQALKEKWFVANSLEDGVLSSHMAQVVERFPADLADPWLENHPHDFYCSGHNGMLSPAGLLSPGDLYERACRADPNLEAFRRWLNWAKKQPDWRVPDRVADLWRQARRQDVEPLLWLMESTENRGAYQKALKFLEEAEQLDGLNPEVRKAKLRLLVCGVLRHFRQRKAHLASQGIDRIRALPETSDGNLTPAVSALRLVCAALGKDVDAVKKHRADLEEQLGSVAAAYVLQRGLVEASVLAYGDALLQPLEMNSLDGRSLLTGLSKAFALGNLVGVALTIPEEWEDHLSAALMHPNPPLDIAEMLVVGEAALHGQAPELAFAVSAAGMARGGADSRFLFLRARALPLWATERRYHCLCVALELARRERNPELAGRVLDQLRGYPTNMFGSDDFLDGLEYDGFSVKPELLNEVLEEERKKKQFPIAEPNARPRYVHEGQVEERDSPRSRRRRNDFDEQQMDAEDFAELEELMEVLPPEFVSQVLEGLARGKSPEEIMEKLLLECNKPEGKLPRGVHETKQKKSLKSPPLEQGSLF